MFLTTNYGGTSSSLEHITVMSLQDDCTSSSAGQNVKRLSKSMKGDVIEACSGKLKKISKKQGEIKSPGYPKPYPKKKKPIKCRWRIATDKLSLLEISFSRIDLKSKSQDYPQSKSAVSIGI